MVASVFGEQIDMERVKIRREAFIFFQPKNVTMAPDGDLWFHPEGRIAMSEAVCDFSLADIALQKHFMHEMTHVWQCQRGVNLVIEKLKMFFRYGAHGGYTYVRGKALSEYNIEQQACVVADLYVDDDIENPMLIGLRAPGDENFV